MTMELNTRENTDFFFKYVIQAGPQLDMVLPASVSQMLEFGMCHHVQLKFSLLSPPLTFLSPLPFPSFFFPLYFHIFLKGTEKAQK